MIRGRVIADNGTPLVRAEVRIGGLPGAPGQSAPSTFTDDQGRYELTGLPAGRWTVTASKNGYLTTSFGQARASEPARRLDLGEAQTIERIDITVRKAGTIVVRVTDDFGDPIAGVAVRAERFRLAGFEMTLMVDSSAETDDRGEARLRNLFPGNYYVSANAAYFGRGALLDATSSRRVYAPTYFPGTLSTNDAQRLNVAAGQEVPASFSLVPVRAARISGVVRASDGSVPRMASMMFSMPSFGSNVPLQPDGSFTISNVVPGDVTITVRPQQRGAAGAAEESARVALKVTGEDITNLVITTSKGSAVRGRLVFDTGAAPAGARPGFVQVLPSFVEQPAAFGSPTIWHDDWTFEVTSVLGNALLRLRPAPASAQTGTDSAWLLKAVMLEGRDVTDIPFELNGTRDIAGVEVIVTQKRTLLSGTVRDGRDAPVPEPLVVVFPESREQRTPQSRFITRGRAEREGRYTVSGLPPGRYFAAAVSRLTSGEEYEADVLLGLEATAVRVTLAEGEEKTVDLRAVTR